MRNFWDLFRDMNDFRTDMDRMFRMFDLGGRSRPAFRYSFLPGRAARAYPLLNVSEDKDNVYVEALAPGLDPASLQINVQGDQLSIAGEKPGLDDSIGAEAYHRSERAAGRFVRSFTLPAPVDQDKAQASYTDGILSIRLPKAEEAKPRQIAVTVG